jgi:crossover junction endodeoxyribonuclease RuvC
VFVLGIDPGVSRCGYGAVRRRQGRLEAVTAGVLTTPPAEPLPARLAELAHQLRQLLGELRPDAVVVERVLFNANTRTAMSVGQASGLALVAAQEAGCAVVQYSPNEVKQAVAGHGGAGKEEVRRMVEVLLGVVIGPERPDAADALALALCHLAAAPLLARAAAAGAGRTPTAGQP